VPDGPEVQPVGNEQLRPPVHRREGADRPCGRTRHGSRVDTSRRGSDLLSVPPDAYVCAVNMTGPVPDRRDPRPARRTPLRIVTGLLLVCVQLVVAVSPIIDGRLGRGAGPHVESSGLNRHYTHEEATCPTCTAQSIHAPLVSPPALPRPAAVGHIAPAPWCVSACSTDVPSGYLSRAPPASPLS
jgi:hypothetical protein